MAPFHPSKKHSDQERWVCIYPAYINSKKTKAEGRILPKPKCVDNPALIEMIEVLTAHGIRYLVENKKYSRERSNEIPFLGRLRVELKEDGGTPVNAAYPTRKSIMTLLGEMIPKLKSRCSKQGGGDSNQQRNTGNPKKDKGKGKRR